MLLKDAARGLGCSVSTRQGQLQAMGPMQRRGGFLSDTCAWLTLNGIRSEAMQFRYLCQQSLSNVWRKAAFRELLRDVSGAYAHAWMRAHTCIGCIPRAAEGRLRCVPT